ncbi:MAG: EAL domain-containing protein [Myxococcales bacterium]|nr:EAL domain-containing protein [Myxococcales bacterium]
MLGPLDSDRTPRILVVDDDATFLLMTNKTMKASGFLVYTCKTGEEALEIFSEVQPDIVLLDVRLPGIDGIEVCRELRKVADEMMLPILLVTGGVEKDAVARGYAAGATDFIAKPVNWVHFAHRADHLVRTSRGLSELRFNRASLATVQRIAKLGSFTYDPETTETRWSEELCSILDLDVGAGNSETDLFTDMIHPEDKERVVTVSQEALDAGKSFTVDHRLILPNGQVRHVRYCGELLDDGIGRSLVTCIVQDNTHHTRALDQIRYLANFDGLTGLTNRRQFNARLVDTLKHAKLSKNLVAVLILDVDRFKVINDTLGHTAGDRILQVVADRVNNQVRASDCVGRTLSPGPSAEVARVGGDEFTLFLPRIAHPTDAGRVAKRILEAIPEPIEVDGQHLTLTASIGISVYPLDGQDSESLLRQAGRAMTFIKSQGGNNFQYYTESLNQTSLRRLVLESKLREAVDHGSLHLVYQPKCDLRSGEVVGMEALLRWHEPNLGLIPPDEFIPLAEEIGCISKIGQWVLHEATRQNKAWQDRGLKPIPVAVNVSSRQFSDTNLLEVVKDILQETQLDPRFLELEITESAMLEDEDKTTRALEQIRELGIRISLDDFGTGFSSLSYLRRLPLDTLKIDRSFVMDLPDDPDANGIVEAIIAMAHVLKLLVIAEGVETQEQRDFLRSIECDEMQGYLFSKPVPPDEFTKFLQMEPTR